MKTDLLLADVLEANGRPVSFVASAFVNLLYFLGDFEDLQQRQSFIQAAD